MANSFKLFMTLLILAGMTTASEAEPIRTLIPDNARQLNEKHLKNQRFYDRLEKQRHTAPTSSVEPRRPVRTSQAQRPSSLQAIQAIRIPRSVRISKTTASISVHQGKTISTVAAGSFSARHPPEVVVATADAKRIFQTASSAWSVDALK